MDDRWRVVVLSAALIEAHSSGEIQASEPLPVLEELSVTSWSELPEVLQRGTVSVMQRYGGAK